MSVAPLAIFWNIRCTETSYDAEHVHIGNLALPTSQQPGPLFAFGQNIVDKGDKQLFLTVNRIQGQNNLTATYIPTFLYGFTDKLSLFLYEPIAGRLRDGKQCSSGFQDLFVQLEWAFYNKNTPTYLNQATLVGTLILPVGSSTKEPPTGSGSPSIFLGGTLSHNATDWYLFGSLGIATSPGHRRQTPGTSIFYEAGIGKNITYVPHELIFMWMIELNGIYTAPGSEEARRKESSGGNTVFIAPSLWLSTQRVIIQAGIAVPIIQHLKGHQSKTSYWASLYAGWKFM